MFYIIMWKAGMLLDVNLHLCYRLHCSEALCLSDVQIARSEDFDWRSQAREDAGLEFWNKEPGLVTWRQLDKKGGGGGGSNFTQG